MATRRAASRPRAAHLGPERRRPMILDAAFEVFLERGYAGASMEQIAERAGVSKPVVYGSFAGKEDLFGALLRREEERILQAIAGAMPPGELSDDLESAVESVVGAFLTAVAASPAAFEVIFLGAGGADAAVTKRVQRGRDAQIDRIEHLGVDWLRRRGVDEERARSEARLMGHVIVSLSEGAARALLEDPSRSPTDLAARVAGMVATGEAAALGRDDG